MIILHQQTQTDYLAIMSEFKLHPISAHFKGDPEAKLLIIYTGGTLGMDYNEDGSLAPLNFDHILTKLPMLSELKLSLSVISFDPPIDSSNIRIDQWGDIARIIEKHYSDFDGFVVLHGTDTMAYSASALSFMLSGLNKPVIFTGAQLPIGSPRSDARENFMGALEIASDFRDGKPMVSEVCVFFNHLLIRGNRSKKVESNHFDAFESENYPVLAEAGVSIDFNRSALRPYDPNAQLHTRTAMDDSVVILKLFPGISEQIVRTILYSEDVKAIVLESYGSGNVPHEVWFLELLKNAIEDEGKIIFNVSQCNGGRVIQGKYQASSRLEKLGVISGGDITTEAATSKLMFALANYENKDTIKSFLTHSISGEMS